MFLCEQDVELFSEHQRYISGIHLEYFQHLLLLIVSGHQRYISGICEE